MHSESRCMRASPLRTSAAARSTSPYLTFSHLQLNPCLDAEGGCMQEKNPSWQDWYKAQTISHLLELKTYFKQQIINQFLTHDSSFIIFKV